MSSLITIENLIENKLVLFNKFTERCEESCTCFSISRQFLTFKGQVAYFVALVEPPLPSYSSKETWLIHLVLLDSFSHNIGPEIGTPSINYCLNHKYTALSGCSSSLTTRKELLEQITAEIHSVVQLNVFLLWFAPIIPSLSTILHSNEPLQCHHLRPSFLSPSYSCPSCASPPSSKGSYHDSSWYLWPCYF